MPCQPVQLYIIYFFFIKVIFLYLEPVKRLIHLMICHLTNWRFCFWYNIYIIIIYCLSPVKSWKLLVNHLMWTLHAHAWTWRSVKFPCHSIQKFVCHEVTLFDCVFDQSNMLMRDDQRSAHIAWLKSWFIMRWPSSIAWLLKSKINGSVFHSQFCCFFLTLLQPRKSHNLQV